MILKRRALRLGVGAAALALCLATASATAKTGGHFVISEPHSLIHVTELGSHDVEFTVHPMEGGIVCDETDYEGTTTSLTVTQIDLKPSYTSCRTTGSATTFAVHANGCAFSLTVAPATTEQTVDLTCPVGSAIMLTHPNCTITIAAQSTVGATYTTVKPPLNTHKLTVDTSLEFAVQFHGGICVFLGTSHLGTLEGSMLISADKTNGQTLDLVAT